ncbi:hypothetical protein F5Y18DRAFT_388626 [Xylariaceae sp. FL1019]|nr:hypothetical protein F5Y18DRAFT_388626 [Xylariaceae sp. FL1019]
MDQDLPAEPVELQFPWRYQDTSVTRSEIYKSGEIPSKHSTTSFPAVTPDPSNDDELGTNTMDPFTSQRGSPQTANTKQPAPFLTLPGELIDAVFSYLTPLQLNRVSWVCQRLRSHAHSEIHWQHHVVANLPGNTISSPYPCKTWRDLYAAHDPYWFLTKHKLWFCDRSLAGKMIIARYDKRRGCIEGYQLLATRRRNDSAVWAEVDSVEIQLFEPLVKLHLDKPVLQLDLDDASATSSTSDSDSSPFRPFLPDKPMQSTFGSDPQLRVLNLARSLDQSHLDYGIQGEFPYGQLWPPLTIPAHERVLGHPSQITRAVSNAMSLRSWKAQRPSEASDQAFRICQWMELGVPPVRFHVNEELVTYSTLDPSLYTPTREKPWKGIWVGDYSTHGCEFILINQPDSLESRHQEPFAKLEGESDEEFEARFLTERVYRGRLEAIKLTGDPNVPRGEYTFIVDDLGERGQLGIAQTPPFEGARIVKSRGHIAGIGFANDRYLNSQLIIVSHNRLAQYWVDFHHISYFERVDIDKFLVPE